jgi:hypothetical protein
MKLLTPAERLIVAALERAEVEQVEDGTLAATIPECSGVVAFGADVHERAKALYAGLEDWVRVSLDKGNPLPVISGIDLNREASWILTTYRPRSDSRPRGEFFANEEELEAAFARRDTADR